jgi:hypothetical protein
MLIVKSDNSTTQTLFRLLSKNVLSTTFNVRYFTSLRIAI